jgi:hypothetical protein
MTDQRHQELPPAKRRRLIIGAVLRGPGDLREAQMASARRLLTLRDSGWRGQLPMLAR